MSDESILILNMLREGKITADQADGLLKAVRPPASAPTPPQAPAAPPPPAADPAALAQMQGKLAELQGKLGDLQGKLGAAQAARAAGQAASLLGKAFEHLPKPDVDYSKINKSVDEALRGLSSLKNDALRTAKMAARQAGHEARRAAREGRRAMDDITAPWAASDTPGDHRPVSSDGKPQAQDSMDTVAAWDGASALVVANTFGHVTLTGREDDTPEARGTLTKTAWADTEAEARVLLQQVFLTNRVEGGKCHLAVVAPADAQGRLTVDVALSVPRTVALEAETTHGDLRMEDASAQAKARTTSGALTMRRPHEPPTGGGEAALQTRSGAVHLDGWNAPQTTLSAQTASGDLAGEGLSCRGLTCSSRSGDITLRRVQTVADALIENVSGDCDIADGAVGGRLQVKTQSGSAKAAQMSAPQIHLETVSGRARAYKITGALTLKTVSGDVDASELSGAASIGTVSGDAHIVFREAFAGSLAASTVSGDLHVSLPPGADTRVEMSTTTGDVRCLMPLGEGGVSSERLTTGTLGGGTGSLKLQSVSGDLTLEAHA